MQGRLSVGGLIEQLWARVNVDSAAQANEKAAIAALQRRFWRQTCFWRAKHEALPARPSTILEHFLPSARIPSESRFTPEGNAPTYPFFSGS
ncbi:hypothetical protein BR10RB9215_C11870 [Brucella sp. 10RB9215]|uniref:hypothetical protein n=1 Tax=unclassified Brucella TaxID=2632610 RepID=UPI00090AF69A|nr:MULTISPECIES: hypothetical protein [unclassified Brucella]MRN46788.1 hypothetical protein [Brucella sp. 10RB9212]MRN48620.1 hypothetical protein [Brucella sp. 10RB9214]SBW15023.1 hypothetical protein BR10RB9215_C11870 [Brucella sp. 10RB9215]